MQNLNINVRTITSDVSYNLDNTLDSKSDLVVIAILGRNYFFANFRYLGGKRKEKKERYEK